MTWNNQQLTAPADTLGNLLGGVHNIISSDNAGKSNALSGVAGFNPISHAGGVTSPDVRRQFTALLQKGGLSLCVHPYQYRVGDTRGDYNFLTPAQAINALAAKLADAREQLEEKPYELAAAIIAEQDGAKFASSLNALCRVFPVSEMQLAARRAEQLQTLEQDKFVTPAGALAPRFVDADPRRHGSADSVYSPLLGQLESYTDEHTRPETELAALIQKRDAVAVQQTAAMDAFRAAFSGATAHTFYATGSPAALRSAVLKSQAPVDVHKYTAIFAVIGHDLNFFREIFQC